MYGEDVTVNAVEHAARCSRCKCKLINSAEIIYIGGSYEALGGSHTHKDNKDW